MRKRFALGVAATGYGKLVTLGVQLGLVPVLALSWGMTLYGQWLILAAVPIFLNASDFGFSSAAGVRFGTEIARGETQEALDTFQSGWLIMLVAGAALLLATIPLSFLLPADLLAVTGGMTVDRTRAALAILLLYSIAMMQWQIFQMVMRAQGRLATSIFIEANFQLLEGLAIAGTAIAGGDPLDAAVAFLAVRLCAMAAHVIIAKKSAPWLSLGLSHASRRRVRELAQPAIAAMFLPLGNALYLQGTAIAIGWAGGAALVPVYATVRTLVRSCRQITMTVLPALMPEFTRAFATGNRQRLARMGGAVTMFSGLTGPVLALFVALFGTWVVRIWTHDAIHPSQTFIVLMAIGGALSVYWYAIGDLLLTINRHEFYTYSYLAMAILSIGMTVILVPHYGVVGAAIANLPLEVVMAIVVSTSLYRNIGKVEMGFAPFVAVLPQQFRPRSIG